MRFALVNNQRVLAEPKQHGLCPVCSQRVTAKCGPQRIWHWAHRGKRTCDPWWKPETEWHRAWKKNFPLEWHEFIHHDQSGEKHIADMRTEHGLIIEFQHSHLDPQERVARERFYGNMVWVLDGTRLTRDYSRFLEGKIDFRPTFLKGFFLKAHPEECFPAAWMESSVPVLFDFRGTAPTEPSDVTRELLWCLLPGRAEGYAVVAAISRSDFVQVVSSRANLLPVPAHELVSTVALQIQQQRANAAAIETGRALTG
jgi:competence protein CoiA